MSNLVTIKMVIKLKKCIIFIVFFSLVVSFLLGVYLYRLKKVDEQIAFETEYSKESGSNIIQTLEKNLKETSSTEIKATPNTRIIEKKYYKDCEHLMQLECNITENLINKNQSEFQIEYIGWEIQKFTKEEIVVYKEINDFCGEHYELKDVEGEIVVYELDKYGKERGAIKETGIETKYLPEADLENLQKGIKVYSNKALNQILEDFE